ncbi:glycosyltransferase involved in cell wall biosynthesis [Methanolinea mesophila]|uniref:glycosyltransferase n=1 Tax=Methanolinea mesophila TaxID=547055 RepID=UPI001AE4DEC0|nr:glycosyltransferase [Methanolinea mesophila]MBP1927935.1 glycosyltransferase involved in cell wall biosynthesis [Methanolinea mesophila]
MKFAIISPVLPPSPSGQAVVLYKLLQDIPSDDFIVISTRDYHKKCRDSCTERFNSEYFYMPGLHILFKQFILITNFFGVKIFLRAYLNKRASDYTKILAKNGCQLAIVCTADLFEPDAVCSACKKLQIPLYFYIFDDYILQWHNRSELKFAGETGPLVIKNAEKVIVANECLKREYHKRYGIESDVIHNPVNMDFYKRPGNSGFSSTNLRIVYTGDVGEAHYDAFRNMISALKLINRRDVKLHIYTGRRKARLVKERITGPFVVIHPHQSITSIPDIQENADILFLPLAFRSKYPDFIIDSASPGKMGEYLAAGRAILVHAPAGSFVSWYFKKNNCGIVVDSTRVEDLAGAIRQLLEDRSLRQNLGDAAKSAADRDFNLDRIRSQFRRIVYENQTTR